MSVTVLSFGFGDDCLASDTEDDAVLPSRLSAAADE
jgi:hypothetical protein